MSARAVLLTVLGELVLPLPDRAAWTQTLVAALATVDVEEKNARQAIARLADDDLLHGDRTGRRVRWHLTPTAVELLTHGADRIYRFGERRERWDGRWLVVICPVPEEQRAKRRQLRARLGFAGFGFPATGTAISPHVEREDLAHDVLKDLGLVQEAVVLRAVATDLVPLPELVQRAWDLAEVDAAYRAFVARFGRRTPSMPAPAVAALIALVHAWRRFPSADPELPAELLPRDWPGGSAKALFDRRRRAWSPLAAAWFAAADG